jgi:hypothetical protein
METNVDPARFVFIKMERREIGGFYEVWFFSASDYEHNQKNLPQLSFHSRGLLNASSGM